MGDPLDFSGRRALVTGAGGGIGGAVVELLLERGAAVLGTDLSPAGLEAARARGAEVVSADLGDAAGRETVAAAAGSIDHVVVAHGIVRPKPIAETGEDDWDAIVGINAKATYFLLQRLAPAIADGGSVVTLSSVSARSAASQEQSVYCASKAAVSSITRSFAYLLAPRGVRVNAVLPGIIDTAMQESFLAAAATARGSTPAELHATRLGQVPLGRTSSPRECAETVVWLLSPAAGYLTGQQIAPDGGLTMT